MTVKCCNKGNDHVYGCGILFFLILGVKIKNKKTEKIRELIGVSVCDGATKSLVCNCTPRKTTYSKSH